MNDWYFINMYSLPNEVLVSVFADRNNLHNVKLEVYNQNKGKNLLLEGNGKLSRVSQIIYPNKKTPIVIPDVFYHEISQENISKLLDCTWYNQLVCGKEE